MHEGLFITLEGIEGAGKSSSLNYISELFICAGHEVLQTREPGGTDTGEQIRKILLDSDNIKLESSTELLLMFAARSQHLEEIVKPALEKDQVVICDRFTDASYAYQGGGRGIEELRIKTLEDWVQLGFTPTVTLLFDLDVDVGLRRAEKRRQADRFEQEDIMFFKRVRSSYLQRASNEPIRFRIINAGNSLEDVKQQIHKALQEYAFSLQSF